VQALRGNSRPYRAAGRRNFLRSTDSRFLGADQSGVLIVGYSYGYFESRDLVRMGAWLTIVEFVVLVLLVPFYWPLIGIK